MAKRPIFIPITDSVGVREEFIDFKWHPGMALVQKQKSINELHEEARKFGIEKVLEISSKSEIELGVRLSAFNLKIKTKKYRQEFSVESAFQASKVFENGGPYRDLLQVDSRTAKKDARIRASGNLTHFDFFHQIFPNKPRTFFYDWIYINALIQNGDLSDQALAVDGFSDIEFNPKKSINCQAHSVALFISLTRCGRLAEALESPSSFLSICSGHYERQRRGIDVQGILV